MTEEFAAEEKKYYFVLSRDAEYGRTGSGVRYGNRTKPFKTRGVFMTAA